jgi:hypothetical protein
MAHPDGPLAPLRGRGDDGVIEGLSMIVRTWILVFRFFLFGYPSPVDAYPQRGWHDGSVIGVLFQLLLDVVW